VNDNSNDQEGFISIKKFEI
jgi:hypothetical protein